MTDDWSCETFREKETVSEWNVAFLSLRVGWRWHFQNIFLCIGMFVLCQSFKRHAFNLQNEGYLLRGITVLKTFFFFPVRNLLDRFLLKLCVCRWLVFSDPGFQGLLAVLEEGVYPCPQDWGFPTPFVGSLRPLKMVITYHHSLSHTYFIFIINKQDIWTEIRIKLFLMIFTGWN